MTQPPESAGTTEGRDLVTRGPTHHAVTDHEVDAGQRAEHGDGPAPQGLIGAPPRDEAAAGTDDGPPRDTDVTGSDPAAAAARATSPGQEYTPDEG